MTETSRLPAMMLAAFLSTAAGCDDDIQRTAAPPPGVGSSTIETVSYDAVYVVNGADSSISVINAENETLAATIKFSGLPYPHHVSLSPDRSLLALAIPGYDMSGGEYGHEHHSSRPGRVVLLNALDGSFHASTPTAAANNNVIFSADGSQVWTSMATQPGATLVLDTASLALRETMKVGTSPAETTISDDGQLVIVANSGSSSVSIINAAERRVAQTINVGAGPVLALPSRDGNIYVENERDRTITVIDRTTLQVRKTFDIGYLPGSVAIWRGAGGGIFVTSPDRGVVEHRSAEGAVLQTIPTGKGAQWTTFSADDSRAFVSNEHENTVSVIDTKTMKVKSTIPVGAMPNGSVWRSR